MYPSLSGDRFVRPSKGGLQLTLTFRRAEHGEGNPSSEIISSEAWKLFLSSKDADESAQETRDKLGSALFADQ